MPAKLKVVAPVEIEISDEAFEAIKAGYTEDNIDAEYAILKPFYENIASEDVRSATVERDDERYNLWEE